MLPSASASQPRPRRTRIRSATHATRRTSAFDFLTVSDHLQGTHDTYETWTELTWVAAGTGAHRPLPECPRPPLPPSAGCCRDWLKRFDRLSGGRLSLGLGAGGFEREFRGFGLPFGHGAERLAALEEAIEIIRRMWREPTVSFQGRHYVTDEAQIEPKAAQAIPIYLGVYGPRALALTGRLADGWSVSRASPEELLAMYAAVRRASEAAGRPANAVAVNYNVGVLVSDRARPNGPGKSWGRSMRSWNVCAPYWRLAWRR